MHCAVALIPCFHSSLRSSTNFLRSPGYQHPQDSHIPGNKNNDLCNGTRFVEPRRVSSERQRVCRRQHPDCPTSRFRSSSEQFRAVQSTGDHQWAPSSPYSRCAGHLAAPQSDSRFLRPAHGTKGISVTGNRGSPTQGAADLGKPTLCSDSKHLLDIPTMIITALRSQIAPLPRRSERRPRRSEALRGAQSEAGRLQAPRLVRVRVDSEHPQDIPTIPNFLHVPASRSRRD